MLSVIQGSGQLYVLTSLSLSQHAPMQPMIEPANVAIIPRTENAVTALRMAIIALISSQSSTEKQLYVQLDIVDNSISSKL
jgi:hypothetical protein